ncbi:putative cytochrome P450 oxidoreductase [Rosellinia necatrix]|uniref:Putative cytochrome P450 oxidoreductase n=1 Tax=Rosellinia necatrix TaxID=77044 RepID=A0A1W2TR17_ROSNE|nr:putative cytochrome P450 oxidoreductase [Rosellinia necatrix]
MWNIQNNIIEPYQVIRQSIAPLKLSRWQMVKLVVKAVAADFPTSIWVFIASAVFLLTLYLKTRPRVKIPHDLPVVRGRDSHFEDVLKEGRKKYPDTPFLAKNNRHSFIIFPPKCFDELKRLPEHTASAKAFFHAANYGDWTFIGTETQTLLKTIIADLTRSMPARVLNRQQDCRIAFESIIGYCPEWKEFNLLMSTFKIVAKVNACSFVGRELGTNENWVKAVMMSPLVIHVAVTLMNACPPLLRPLLSPLAFLPTMKNQWDMKRLLTPMIKEDIKTFEATEDKKELLRPKYEGKIPFTAMLLSRYKGSQASIQQLVEDYILVSFDSTPSTASALYHVLCELSIRPEAVDILRRELSEIMVDGKLPSTHLQELKRMDSFLRESFRMHPVSLFSLQRVTEKPVKLSAGPEIPAGAIIGVDAAAINRSPELWENPDEFDMNRFYNLRQNNGNENKFHFLTTGSDSPGWGDGTQACPGRFFATSTIKIALAYIIQHYDIKMREGDYPAKMTPLANGTWAPDTTTTVYLKSRADI